MLWPSILLCNFVSITFPPSSFAYFNLCYASALKCLSVLFVNLCFILATSTTKVVQLEYIKTIFVAIFVSFAVQFSYVVCLFGVATIYQMTWLTAAALIRGVSDCFSLPVMEDPIVAGPSVPNTTTTNTKPLWHHLKKQLKSGHIALFWFKHVTFCVPSFSFAAWQRTVTYCLAVWDSLR